MPEAADRVVVELEARTQAYQAAVTGAGKTTDTAMSQIERAASKAEGAVQTAATEMSTSVLRAANDIEKGSARAAAASRNLGRQISDIGVGLTGGQSPFIVLSQQAPQVADALADTGGKAAAVATYFAGPFGAALLAAGSALGVLVSKALETGETVEGLTEKLKDNAEKARLAAQAQAIFDRSLEGAADASEKLNKRLKEQNQSQLEVAQSALAAAQALRQTNLQNLRAEQASAQKEFNLARGARDSSNFSAVAGAAGVNTASQSQRAAIEAADARLAKARERLKIANDALAASESAVVEASVPILRLQAAENADKSAAATGRHERAVNKLTEAYREAQAAAAKLGGTAGNAARAAAVKAYRDGVAAADRELASEQSAIQSARRSSGATGPLVTQSAIDAAIRAAGGRLGSGTRSAAEQNALFARGVTNLNASNSPHVIGVARDVPVNGLTNAQAEALREEIKRQLATAGIKAQVILEDPANGGRQGTGRHIHVGVARGTRVSDGTIESAQDAAARDAARAAKDAQRDADRYADQLGALDQRILQLKGKQVVSLEDQVAAALASVDADQKERDAKFDRARRDGDITDAQREELRARSALVASLERTAINADAQERRDRDGAETNAALVDARSAQLRYEQDTSRSLDRRKAIELELIGLRYDELEATQLAVLYSDRSTAAQKQIAELRLEQLKAERGSAVYGVTEGAKGAYQRYREGLDDADQQRQDLERFKVNTLDQIGDDLARATTEALGLKGALGNIVQELIRIGIQRRLIGPIGDALFGKADGSTGGFLGGLLGGVLGLKGHAQGGSFVVGGNAGLDRNVLAVNGTPVARVNQGERLDIVPAGLAQRGGGDRHFHIAVDARNSVTPARFAEALSATILAEADKMDGARQGGTLRAVPGVVQKAQRFGSN